MSRNSSQQNDGEGAVLPFSRKEAIQAPVKSEDRVKIRVVDAMGKIQIEYRREGKLCDFSREFTKEFNELVRPMSLKSRALQIGIYVPYGEDIGPYCFAHAIRYFFINYPGLRESIERWVESLELRAQSCESETSVH